MMPCARITDMHICPMVTGIVPHVGGPILPPGVPTVLVSMLPAAPIANPAVCVGPPDMTIKGSATVLVGGRPVTRMLDQTVHGGMIVGPCAPTVLVGG